MSGATRGARLPLAVGLVAALALLAGALFVPFEARDSAPYGSNASVDFSRYPAIAVSGRSLTTNYPNFNRIELDLRAYQHTAQYDLTIHIRPNTTDASDVRTLSLNVSGEKIRDDKPAFADPYVSLSFPPIADSAGQQYYVWVERGPRNRDNVVALWSVRAYSRVTGRDVLGAFLDTVASHRVGNLAQGVLILLMAGLVAAFGWLMATTTALALAALRGGKVPAPVASVGGRWYTVRRIARRTPRRAVMFGGGPGADPNAPQGAGSGSEPHR